MKKSLIAIFLIAALAISAVGCGKKTVSTEMSVKNIVSLTVDGQGTVYLLSDTGLRYYTLSGDKNIEYIFDSDDLAEATFKLNDRGEILTYSAFLPEKIIANGETGLQFVGCYRVNDAGRDSDLFVVQDILDMNYTAAYYADVQKGSGSGAPIIGGLGVTDKGIYLKLTQPYVDDERFNDGVSFGFDGFISAYAMPDKVVGAIETGEGDEAQVYFLTLDKDKAAVISNDETVAGFKDVANAFVNGGSVYVMYKNGKITNWTPGGEETDFADLKTRLSHVNDPFIWEGTIYWFDEDGVKKTNI